MESFNVLEKKNNYALLIKLALILATLSQIFLPLYSDANFFTLAYGDFIYKNPQFEITPLWFPLLFIKMVYSVHYYFGDLGVIILSFLLVLVITSLLFLVLRCILRDGFNELLFFLYLVTLVGVFYGQDLSYAYLDIIFFLFLSLIIMTFFSQVTYVAFLGLIFAFSRASINPSLVGNPVGMDFSFGIYAHAVNLILFSLLFFVPDKAFKKALRLILIFLILTVSLFSPYCRMLISIYLMLLIAFNYNRSEALVRLADVFSRLLYSLRFLNGYALIFFLLAFSFSQIAGVFRYPQTTLFMPAKEVDSILPLKTCISDHPMLREKSIGRFAGYLMYREEYDLKSECFLRLFKESSYLNNQPMGISVYAKYLK